MPFLFVGKPEYDESGLKTSGLGIGENPEYVYKNTRDPGVLCVCLPGILRLKNNLEV